MQVNYVIKFAERICLQRDKLIDERKEAIAILGGRYNVNMVDLAVERIVHQWVKDMLECKQKIGDLDKKIRELNSEIRTLEMIGPYQIKRRERTIEELERQLEKKVFQVSRRYDQRGQTNERGKTKNDALCPPRRI